MEYNTPIIIFRHDLSGKSWIDEFTIPSGNPNGISNAKFADIWDLHPKTRHKIVIYGKETHVPRFQKSYMNDYSFSGSTAKADPLPDILKPYLKWADSLGYGKFNQFLLNWYENGENYIGSHADDEGQLVAGSPIVTITLCGESPTNKINRTFRIRDKKSKSIIQDFETADGCVLVMGGKFQKEFKHEIVKINGKKAKETAKRISITLRQFK